jgi:hypothetical protein
MSRGYRSEIISLLFCWSLWTVSWFTFSEQAKKAEDEDVVGVANVRKNASCNAIYSNARLD